MNKLLLLLLLTLLFSGSLYALSPLPDSWRVVSPNGQYALCLSRSHQRQSVARIQGGQTLWQFEADASGRQYFLSNDGTTVAEINGGPVVHGVRLLRAGKVLELPLLRLTHCPAGQAWLQMARQQDNQIIVQARCGLVSQFDLGDFALVSQARGAPVVELSEGWCGTEPRFQCGPCVPIDIYTEEDLAIDAGASLLTFLLLGAGLGFDLVRRRRERSLGAAHA